MKLNASFLLYLSFTFCILFKVWNKYRTAANGECYWCMKTLHLYHKDQTGISRKRIRQEFKKTRILSGETILASPAKIRSTWFLSEGHDLIFQTRILAVVYVKRILTDQARKIRIWKERWQERRLVYWYFKSSFYSCFLSSLRYKSPTIFLEI